MCRWLRIGHLDSIRFWPYKFSLHPPLLFFSSLAWPSSPRTDAGLPGSGLTAAIPQAEACFRPKTLATDYCPSQLSFPGRPHAEACCISAMTPAPWPCLAVTTARHPLPGTEDDKLLPAPTKGKGERSRCLIWDITLSFQFYPSCPFIIGIIRLLHTQTTALTDIRLAEWPSMAAHVQTSWWLPDKRTGITMTARIVSFPHIQKSLFLLFCLSVLMHFCISVIMSFCLSLFHDFMKDRNLYLRITAFTHCCICALPYCYITALQHCWSAAMT